MNEIRELRTRWQTRRRTLLRADYNHADEALARALYFADNQALISGILSNLRAMPIYTAFDADTWLEERRSAAVVGAGLTNLGFSLDDAEEATQCLRVLEAAVERFEKDRQGLLPIGSTTYGGRSTGIAERVRSAIELLFDPFYHYVDTQLRAQETLITATDIMNDIQMLVDSQASVRYPDIHQLLIAAYRQLFSTTAAGPGVSWNQPAYQCRDALISFANEVFDPSFVPQGSDQPKGSDAQEKLKWTVRHYLKQAGAGDTYREGIEKIVQANWKFVSTVGHRQESSTEEDARLAVIYTYLTISLVDRVIRQSAGQDE